jgi:hypothetical protein
LGALTSLREVSLRRMQGLARRIACALPPQDRERHSTVTLLAMFRGPRLRPVLVQERLVQQDPANLGRPGVNLYCRSLGAAARPGEGMTDRCTAAAAHVIILGLHT